MRKLIAGVAAGIGAAYLAVPPSNTYWAQATTFAVVGLGLWATQSMRLHWAARAIAGIACGLFALYASELFPADMVGAITYGIIALACGVEATNAR